MEAAHLVHAHDHVRNASLATFNNSVSAASTEHEQAASDFAQASKDTDNVEALRILALLESHHHHLAALIKSPAGRAAVSTGGKDQETVSQNEDTPTIPSPAANAAADALSPRPSSPSPSTSSPPRAASRRRPPRDHSSSIASNLATARGIPGVQTRRAPSPSVSTATAVASTLTRGDRQSRPEQDSPLKDALQRQAKRSEEGGKRSDRSIRSEQGNQEQAATKSFVQVARSASPSPEDGFQRFYSTFEHMFSAISAPLAFASLPLTGLTTPAAAPPPPAKTPRTSAASEPDITSYISKPALRALREEQGPSGPFANAESFYVVPTSGGTLSYANIISHQPTNANHLPDLIEEDTSDRGSAHDEFVDASETPYPPSPTSQRHMRRSSKPLSGASSRTIPAGRGAGLKTMEELQLENETLRKVLDQQSKRLQMWEATSQSSSMALAQSFRAARGAPSLKTTASDPTALTQAIATGAIPPVPPLPSSPSAKLTANPMSQTSSPDPKPSADLEAKVAGLLQTVATLTTDKEYLAKENEKQVRLLGKYREQWEKLKAGARKKEREREEAKKVVAKPVENEGVVDSANGDVEVEEEEEEAGFGKA